MPYRAKRYWIIAPYHADQPRLWKRVWQYDLEHNLISIGWRELGDASSLTNDELKQKVNATYLDLPPSTRTLYRRMYRDFYHTIKEGDVIIARRGRKSISGIGTVTREAFYEPDKNASAAGADRAYSNHLGVEWWSGHRDIMFDSIMFGMQTIYEISEEKFKSLLVSQAAGAPKTELSSEEPRTPPTLIPPALTKGASFEPIKALTVGSLTAANNLPVFVKRDWEISEAITRMRINDYSQLPVMATPWQVEGWVSWKSIGLASGVCQFVRDCIDEPVVKLWDDHPLLDAVETISEKEVVLIQSRNTKEIIGLVTISDLADHYHSLAEPFLLIGEIENYIRQLIARGDFTIETIRTARDPNDDRRRIDGVSDLSLGECVRFLETDEHWTAIEVKGLKKEPILERLHRVLEIRNRVMHFRPDASSPEETSIRRDLSTLRSTVRFLGSLN